MDTNELQEAEILPPDDEQESLAAGPQMNVTVAPDDASELVPNEWMTGLWVEILDTCRGNRKECDHLLANFVEMVMNEGDSTSASKEAISAILKTKVDITDQMIKVAGQLQAQKLKKPATKVEAAQHNHFHANRRSLLRELESIAKENKKQK